jgi:hypothetical protein
MGLIFILSSIYQVRSKKFIMRQLKWVHLFLCKGFPGYFTARTSKISLSTLSIYLISFNPNFYHI